LRKRKIEKIDVIKEINKKGNITTILKFNNLIKIIISPAKLIEGGAEMLAEIKINHQKVILGKEFHNPLNEIMFRV